MGTEEIINIFALNQGTALKTTKVPKARFLELPNITAAKRKLLSDEIEEVTLLAVFNSDTTNVLSVRTEEVVYEEVYFLHIALKKDTHLGELNQLLQQNITNPTIIFYSLGDRLAMSVAPKRLSKNASGETVVDAYYLTDWLDPTQDEVTKFLATGAITNGSFMNLEKLYLDFASYVRHAELLPFTKVLIVDRRREWDQLDTLLQNYRDILRKIRLCMEEERTHAAFGDKLSFRSKLVALEKEKEALILDVQALIEAGP